MYRIRILPSADIDLIGAEVYLGEYSPTAADKLSEAFEKKVDALVDNPFIYMVYNAKPYFRFMSLPYEYLCFYHVDDDTQLISIHRVLRGMRDIPNIL